MSFRSMLFLGLAFCGGASQEDVDAVARSTAQVISTMQETVPVARKRFANTSKFDEQLDEIGHSVESDFDAKRYSEKTRAFRDLARRASEKAAKCLSTTNASIAEDLSDEAEEALRNMTKADAELDAMEKTLHDELHGALLAKLIPELMAVDKVSGEVSSLNSKAHGIMDSLYSAGDNAEDKADRLNDQANNALSAVEKPLRMYGNHIADHTRDVQRAVERRLFADGQDRTAIWRTVNRKVRAATGHSIFGAQSLASASVLSLQLGSFGGLAVLMAASAAAAVVGTLVPGVAKAMIQKTRRSDYQLLSA